MNETFQILTKTDDKLFFKKNDRNDVRLGEIVANVKYQEANIVIVGCPQDEGVKRLNGREGAALAPDLIREEFYKLTNFGVNVKICDLGNIEFKNSLEETHEDIEKTVKKILEDGKKVIVLGGASDISYSTGKAMADVYGSKNWIGVNISAYFNVCADKPINSENHFRHILDEQLIRSDYLYQIAYQTHFSSPVYYRYLHNLGVNLSSLEQIRSRESADLELREMMREKFIKHSQSLNSLFSFNLTAVRSADAPGNSKPSPLGLRAGEFITIVKFAASLSNTKVIEFTDVNPNYDIDDRTVKLVAIAMHRFCTLQSK